MGSGKTDRVATGVLDHHGRAITRFKCDLSAIESRKRSEHGHQLPKAEVVVGLIDTGCNRFCLGSQVIHRLGLTLTDQSDSKTAAGLRVTNYYNARIAILGDDDEVLLDLPNQRVSELPPEFPEFQALIGWSALQHAELEYSGPRRRFSMRF